MAGIVGIDGDPVERRNKPAIQFIRLFTMRFRAAKLALSA
jgi:hypothetical protein